MTGPKRILILGGGFGGVYTALTLEKLLKREIRRGEVELGAANIIEGSEEISMGGEALVRGTDYQIFYDYGRVVFSACVTNSDMLTGYGDTAN